MHITAWVQLLGGDETLKYGFQIKHVESFYFVGNVPLVALIMQKLCLALHYGNGCGFNIDYR